MRFNTLFLIAFIIYHTCECRQGGGYQDQDEAAWHCTKPSEMQPGYFDCKGYPSDFLFQERILDGKDYCLIKVILNGYVYYYCATDRPPVSEWLK